MRSHQCAGDAAAATAVGDAFAAAATCAADMADPTLPLACSAALLQVDCGVVAQAGADPAAWLALSPACDGVFSGVSPAGDSAADTGGPPPTPYTGLGSCDAPLSVPLDGVPVGEPFALVLPAGVGDSFGMPACPSGSSPVDIVLRFTTPAAPGAPVVLTLEGPASLGTVPYLLTGDPEGCPPDTALGLGCGAVTMNTPTVIAQAAGAAAARRVVLQPPAGVDLGAAGVVARCTVEAAPGTPSITLVREAQQTNAATYGALQFANDTLSPRVQAASDDEWDGEALVFALRADNLFGVATIPAITVPTDVSTDCKASDWVAAPADLMTNRLASPANGRTGASSTRCRSTAMGSTPPRTPASAPRPCGWAST